MKNRSSIRIIGKLDIKGPNVVKGIQFDGFRVLGTPEYFAQMYSNEGVDEIIYQDAVASLYQRDIQLDVVRRTAQNCFIPLTVAGGLRTMRDIEHVLRAGADKVAINTSAIAYPELINEAAKSFGSQCVVVSIEAHPWGVDRYEAWVNYGRERTNQDVLTWAKQAVDLGAGEILLTAVHRDGTGRGFDIDLTRQIASQVGVPVIACGGAGAVDDFSKVITGGMADAVAAASIFHYHYLTVPDTLWMSFNEPRLRMGAPIDSGNIDFIKWGYGELRDIYVKPASIREVKAKLHAAGLNMRNAPAASVNAALV